jgi:hypothetical protein
MHIRTHTHTRTYARTRTSHGGRELAYHALLFNTIHAPSGGHGYKWASFIGLVLSQLALNGKTTFPVEALAVTRPAAGLRACPKAAAL